MARPALTVRLALIFLSERKEINRLVRIGSLYSTHKPSVIILCLKEMIVDRPSVAIVCSSDESGHARMWNTIKAKFARLRQMLGY